MTMPHSNLATSEPLLFYHPSMADLAHRIQEHCDIICAAEDTPGLAVRDSFKWNRFRDGFPNLFIENVQELADSDVIFLTNFDSPEVVFEQLAMIYSIPRHGYLVRSFTILLPYFPTGTMERVDKEGQICTAKVLAMMLSKTPLSALGPCQLVIFDIHNLTERFYFDDQIIPRMVSAIPGLLERFTTLPDAYNLIIAFPDEGAHKRFQEFFTAAGYETIICTKVRDGDKRVVRVKEGNCQGKHVVIVDDLVQTGETLIQCARALLQQGPTHVSCYCTHAVFPNDSWRKFLNPEGLQFKYFWITDSCPKTVAAIGGSQPFELLSLASIIAKMLHSYDMQRMSLRRAPRVTIP